MASAGSVPNSLGNGVPFSGRQPTPADMVGNQFVSQFYTVLHSSPRFLHRFYTDDSTVTHADCGIDGEPPRSTTVSTQRGISDRVLAMGFEEAVTEIWSVDSQYSQNSGVVVMVTGSLQCKGKKKRDFVQSFFLAVQEKGYFVLNDTFRYLSDRANSRPTQYSKENGYIQSDYNKVYSQMGGYPPNQPTAYYPGASLSGQPHSAVGNVYNAHVTPLTYPTPEPTPTTTTVTQPRSEVGRGQMITPSMPQRAAAPAPTPQAQVPGPAKPATATQGPPAQAQQQQQPQPVAAPITHPQPAAVVHTAPPPQHQQPASVSHAPAESKLQQQTVKETPKPAAAAPVQPAAPKTEAAPAVQPPVQPKPITKPEPVQSTAEPVSKPIEQPPEPEEPSAPLTYAERLKLGSRAPASKPAVKPSSAPPTKPAPTSAPAPAPAPAPITAKPPPHAAFESNGPSDGPSTTQPSGDVNFTPEETVTTSIFVRDLPEGITPEKIEGAFSRFGAVKGGVQGVNLKQQKGKEDFAFVEFEEAAAMQAAVEGVVIIDGKTATVMERRPMFPRNLRGPGYQRREGGGRGGEGRGFRGGPGRIDRGRGRNDGRSFGPGRGEGRGEGREGGRGRGFGGNFGNEGRGEGGRGRGPGGEGGRGRGPGGRNPRGPQSAPPQRPQQQA